MSIYYNSLCRINGDDSGAITKLYGDGHAPFPTGLRQASENMESAMKV